VTLSNELTENLYRCNVCGTVFTIGLTTVVRIEKSFDRVEPTYHCCETPEAIGQIHTALRNVQVFGKIECIGKVKGTR
jgi:hypothetical protein